MVGPEDAVRGAGRPAHAAAGVMGTPIAQSLSPALHLAAYRSLGLTGWSYVAQEVSATQLAAALDRLGPEWVGVSLTMPLKQAVLPLLDEVSALARDVGAVNTVSLGRHGRSGDNTDVHGIVAALRAAGVGDGHGAVVLGGGATAASALAAVRDLGGTDPSVVVRSRERASLVMAAGERLGVRVRLVSWDQAADELARAPVAVSTVPPGAADSVLPPVVAAGAVLLDVVYRPWPTRLAAAWVAAGGTSVPGIEMLLHQAAGQVHAWTGEWPDLPEMRRAALSAMA
jgi:shikimate-5-dehydrogenase